MAPAIASKSFPSGTVITCHPWALNLSSISSFQAISVGPSIVMWLSS